jgi:hypothetical protein
VVVVGRFDVLNDCRACLRSGLEVRIVYQLLLEVCEKTLQGCIVPAVAALPHAAGDAVLCLEASVGFACLLAVAVRMRQQSCRRQPALELPF